MRPYCDRIAEKDDPMTNSTKLISPFTVDIPQQELDDLHARLRGARFPSPLPGDGWDTGVPVSYLRTLVEAWRSFDWRAVESRLADIPQFTTQIDGQTIHFAHVVSPVATALPLLLTHGWPGSFLEFVDLIGPLTDPGAHGGDPADAFHVVIPSLPGFGFSTPVVAGGWTTSRIATVWVELMDRLGYDRFATQGGDIGAGVAPEVARIAPERVIGVHVNGALGSFGAAPNDEALATMSPIEQDRIRRVGDFMQNEFGYISIQSTRPGLIGVALADSPVGQLAWIVDKLMAWSHPTEALPDSVLGLDFLLANASLYWFTASGGSSAYVGYAQDEGWGAVSENSGVPTAAIQFAHDIGIRASAEQSNTIVRWTDVNDRGGHFAALEEPEALVTDIRDFLRPLRN